MDADKCDLKAKAYIWRGVWSIYASNAAPDIGFACFVLGAAPAP
jgi:hypothetical protein